MEKKIKIHSYTYHIDDKKHTAKPIPASEKDAKEALGEENCVCGSTKCINGVLYRCMPLDNEGTCIWFRTNEPC